MSTVLSVSLKHDFSDRFCLDVSMESDARSVALVGPSASGKTTVLRCIAGLFRADSGRIIVGGRVLCDSGVWLAPRHRKIGYVDQKALLFPLMSVRSNLLFGRPTEEGRLPLHRVVDLLEIPQLLDRRPRHLSGGERNLVALGRALLSEPQYLLFDEPFAALDQKRRQRLIPILTTVRDELGVAMLLVSHSIDDVRALAEEVIELDQGLVINQTRVTPVANVEPDVAQLDSEPARS